jgi:hypothetical protein
MFLRRNISVTSIIDFVFQGANQNLEELIYDLDGLELLQKNNDLYQFKQSKDLVNIYLSFVLPTVSDFLLFCC